MKIPIFPALGILLAGCGSDTADDAIHPVRAPEIPHLVPAQQAISTAHVSTMDPETMNDAEVSKVLGEGAFCAFRYVSHGKPVLAWKRSAENAGVAVVKLNGLLVQLEQRPDQQATRFTADEIVMSMTPLEPSSGNRQSEAHPRDATLVFEIGQKLRVGYGGYAICGA